MMLCSQPSRTRCSTTCWRTDARQGTATPRLPHRPDPHRRLRARLLLDAERGRPGVRAEDLLPARADGDRGAVWVRGRWGRRAHVPAHPRREVGSPRLRRHPPVADPGLRRAHHGLDLGQGVVGALVAVGRADARVLPHRVPAVRDLPGAALLDRGPRAPGALRLRVRGRGGRVRADQLRRRAHGAVLRASAHAGDDDRRDARRDAADVPRRPRRDGAAVRDALEVRDGVQERRRPGARAAPAPPRRRRRPPAAQRGPPGLMPALPLDEAGKYVAAAYLVFLALLLIYVAIMSGRLGRLERDLTDLNRDLAERDRADGFAVGADASLGDASAASPTHEPQRSAG